MEFNRFDVSAKDLVWDDPAAWLDRLGIGPPGPVEVIDSDITTLTASADKVIRVAGLQPYLVNVELSPAMRRTWSRPSGFARSPSSTATGERQPRRQRRVA